MPPRRRSKTQGDLGQWKDTRPTRPQPRPRSRQGTVVDTGRFVQIFTDTGDRYDGNYENGKY